jgi:Uma2 family endonuclease
MPVTGTPDTLIAYRWSRAEYEEIAAAGVFGEKRVELLHGAIFGVTAPSPEHSLVIEALTRLFAPVADAVRLRVQLPLAATDDSMPEPDVMLAPLDEDPHPASGLLAVEVVVSRRLEARIKTEIYAAARVSEYWIVDVPRRAVEVLTVPGQAGYAQRRDACGTDVLAVSEFGVAFTVDRLFAEAGLGRS